ncbi:MAG: HAMP domain-containing sensor histidine kinase [Dehalococcoidia bacterium]
MAGSDFLVTLAHELRTPISSLRVSFDLLKDPAVEKGSAGELQRLMDNAERSLGRLEIQVANLLEIGYLRDGALSLRQEWASIHLPVSSALDQVRSAAMQRSVAVELTVEEDLPDVYVDAVRVSQILVHLLSNGIKFTPVNGVVTLAVTKTGANDDVSVTSGGLEDRVLHMTVTDEGPGIDPAHAEKVFLPFYQVESGPSGGRSGAGLGLAMAKGLVELHGGRIWVESEMGGGSRFHFTIPCEAKR